MSDLLEPMADVSFAIGELEKLLPRLRPARLAFERLNQAHGTIRRLESEIKGLKRRLAELEA